MILGEVVGTVTSTEKHYKVEGRKLLLVRPLDLAGRPAGDAFLAVDAVDAGIGDRVLVVREGKAASQVSGRPESPVDAAIVGVVDEVRIES